MLRHTKKKCPQLLFCSLKYTYIAYRTLFLTIYVIDNGKEPGDSHRFLDFRLSSVHIRQYINATPKMSEETGTNFQRLIEDSNYLSVEQSLIVVVSQWSPDPAYDLLNIHRAGNEREGYGR